MGNHTAHKKSTGDVSVAQLNRFLKLASADHESFPRLVGELVDSMARVYHPMSLADTIHVLLSDHLVESISSPEKKKLLPITWEELGLRKMEACLLFRQQLESAARTDKAAEIEEALAFYDQVWTKLERATSGLENPRGAIMLREALMMSHFNPTDIIRAQLQSLSPTDPSDSLVNAITELFEMTLVHSLNGEGDFPETWKEFDARNRKTYEIMERMLSAMRESPQEETKELLGLHNETITSIINIAIGCMKQEVQQTPRVGSYLQ